MTAVGSIKKKGKGPAQKPTDPDGNSATSDITGTQTQTQAGAGLDDSRIARDGLIEGNDMDDMLDPDVDDLQRNLEDFNMNIRANLVGKELFEDSNGDA